jgi:hypothetical protein
MPNNTTKQKPLIDLPKKIGSAQAKLNAKDAATKAMLAEQRKKRLDNAKKNGMK